MQKVKVFFKRIFSASFKRMFNNINIAHEESGKSRIYIFFDMIYSLIVYGTGYLDYLTFGFAGIPHSKRKTFMTMNDNITLDKALNSPEFVDDIEDKLTFDAKFSDLLRRDYLNLNEAKAEDFAEFCKGKDAFFAKQTDSFGGIGVKKIKLDENTDTAALYESLKKDNFTLAEEAIKQHPLMSSLCATSINTLRIATLVNDKGQAGAAYVLVRIGDGVNAVDNVCSGGMYTLAGDDGILHCPAFCEKATTYYDKHPLTGTSIVGFKIPFYQEAIDMCCEAAMRIPQMRYIGWDVGITPDGPCIVEANVLPGYDMPQNHHFHPDGCGLRPKFEEILNMPIGKK